MSLPKRAVSPRERRNPLRGPIYRGQVWQAARREIPRILGAIGRA